MNIPPGNPPGRNCPRFSTIDPCIATHGARNGGMKVTFKEFMKDLAFTFAAAMATGAAVGGVSFVVVRFLAG